MIDNDIGSIFEKAAKSALFSWRQNTEGLDDLVSDLWVWYLERPATRDKMSKLSTNEAVKTARMAALQMLSKNQLTANMFRGMNLYSADSVRAALRGESKNRYLVDILPMARKALDAQNEDYAEAIRIRYEDGIVPNKYEDKAAENRLMRAVKSLTEHVNVIAITAGLTTGPDGTVSPSSKSPGVGRRNEAFPEHRRQRGGDHSDPTGTMAIMLIEHPELRDEYLHEEPITQFLKGRGHAQPN